MDRKQRPRRIKEEPFLKTHCHTFEHATVKGKGLRTRFCVRSIPERKTKNGNYVASVKYVQKLHPDIRNQIYRKLLLRPKPKAKKFVKPTKLIRKAARFGSARMFTDRRPRGLGRARQSLTRNITRIGITRNIMRHQKAQRTIMRHNKKVKIVSPATRERTIEILKRKL